MGTAQAARPASSYLECRAQFTMTSGQTALSAQPGQIVAIAIKLHNLSNLDRYVRMRAGGNTLWPLQLSTDYVPLPVGGDAQVFWQVPVPVTTTPVADGTTDHSSLKVADNLARVYSDLYITLAANQ